MNVPAPLSVPLSMGTPSFKDSPDAYYLWAKSHTDHRKGLERLAEPLRDGSWKDAPAAWVHHLSWPLFWGPGTLGTAVGLRAKLIRTILSGGLDDAAYAALPGIFNTRTLAPLTDAADIVAWLVKKAGPNDVPVVADIVQQVVYDRSLVAWPRRCHDAERVAGNRRGRRSCHPGAAQGQPCVFRGRKNSNSMWLC